MANNNPEDLINNPVPSSKFSIADRNAADLDRFMNQNGDFEGRNGAVRPTLSRILANIGYLPPIAYADGIAFTAGDRFKTVLQDSQIYAPRPSILPFTTPPAFDADQWFLVSGVTRAESQPVTHSSLSVAELDTNSLRDFVLIGDTGVMYRKIPGTLVPPEGFIDAGGNVFEIRRTDRESINNLYDSEYRLKSKYARAVAPSLEKNFANEATHQASDLAYIKETDQYAIQWNPHSTSPDVGDGIWISLYTSAFELVSERRVLTVGNDSGFGQGLWYYFSGSDLHLVIGTTSLGTSGRYFDYNYTVDTAPVLRLFNLNYDSSGHTWSGACTTNTSPVTGEVIVSAFNQNQSIRNILIYSRADFLAGGTITPLFRFQVSQDQNISDQPVQGVAMDSVLVYVSSGTASRATDKLVFCYDRRNGQLIDKITHRYGDVFDSVEGDRREPEGLELVVNPDTGSKSLRFLLQMGSPTGAPQGLITRCLTFSDAEEISQSSMALDVSLKRGSVNLKRHRSRVVPLRFIYDEDSSEWSIDEASSTIYTSMGEYVKEIISPTSGDFTFSFRLNKPFSLLVSNMVAGSDDLNAKGLVVACQQNNGGSNSDLFEVYIRDMINPAGGFIPIVNSGSSRIMSTTQVSVILTIADPIDQEYETLI